MKGKSAEGGRLRLCKGKRDGGRREREGELTREMRGRWERDSVCLCASR